MYRLFEVFGVELEYMIVDRTTLEVRPIADVLIKEMTGSFTPEVDRGYLAWSNELVSHVIELKTNGPAKTLTGLDREFQREVNEINERLEKHNAMLLPTGAHPYFDPREETVIWPHQHNEVYALYDRIFGCEGHGWSNLQSTHLNLPFSTDGEFALLHSAIRILLPIIPAIAASTPVIEGRITEFRDTRLEFYRNNQQKLPMIAGLIVPEHIATQKQYYEQVFEPIQKAIAPYDRNRILDKHFLNSRGAIARFDRGAIEIRVIDIQECPRADIAILEWIVAGLHWLIQHQGEALLRPETISTEALSDIFIEQVRHADAGRIEDPAYLSLFHRTEDCPPLELWKMIAESMSERISADSRAVIHHVTGRGSLASRMLRYLHRQDDTATGIERLYRELARCLAENRTFAA